MYYCQYFGCVYILCICKNYIYMRNTKTQYSTRWPYVAEPTCTHQIWTKLLLVCDAGWYVCVHCMVRRIHVNIQNSITERNRLILYILLGHTFVSLSTITSKFNQNHFSPFVHSLLSLSIVFKNCGKQIDMLSFFFNVKTKKRVEVEQECKSDSSLCSSKCGKGTKREKKTR